MTSALLVAGLLAAGALEPCADQFVDGDVGNAPTLVGSAPEDPFEGNVHLCYRDGSGSYYALEYWPEERAPRWAAYRLTPDDHGPDGCTSWPWQKVNCYLQTGSWDEFLACERASDPFHADPWLPPGHTPAADSHEESGHDRGQLARNQYFTWNVCAAYQTFSMANAVPLRSMLNQVTLANLDRQVLTWALDSGPLYVTAGPVYDPFPYYRYHVYWSERLDPAHIYPAGSTLARVAEQHRANFDAVRADHILRPLRRADPERLRPDAARLRVPTGYFLVVYAPPGGGLPARSIAFMIPHTFENTSMIRDVATDRSHWSFVSRIDLIEETTGLFFPAIPHELKSVWGGSWFFDNEGIRDIAAGCEAGARRPRGVVEHSTRGERLAACAAR